MVATLAPRYLRAPAPVRHAAATPSTARRSAAARAPRAASASAPNTDELRVNINGRELATPAVVEHIQERVAHAARHFPTAIRYVDVKISSQKTKKGPDQKAEVMLHLERTVGGMIRSERHNYDNNLFAAIDGACDAVERKLRKVKEKRQTKDLHGGSLHKHEHINGKALDDPAEGALRDQEGNLEASAISGRRLVVSEVLDPTKLVDADTLPIYAEGIEQARLPSEVVRTKYFDIPAMSAQDAIERMQEVGHAFFAFRNEKTLEVNICYRRQRGGYGVIIPAPMEA